MHLIQTLRVLVHLFNCFANLRPWCNAIDLLTKDCLDLVHMYIDGDFITPAFVGEALSCSSIVNCTLARCWLALTRKLSAIIFRCVINLFELVKLITNIKLGRCHRSLLVLVLPKIVHIYCRGQRVCAHSSILMRTRALSPGLLNFRCPAFDQI